MQHLGSDPTFVREQYSDAERLHIRIQTHERFTQGATERILDDATRALQLSQGLQVLDVGCGAGSWHARLASAGATIVGVDLMPGMLREASLADQWLRPSPILVQADAQALPFEAATFDRVLCASVLYHVPNCEQSLREIRRVLRPGARAVISTNGAYAMQRIYELHGIAARQLGYQPLPITAGHFSMDDLPLVKRVFSQVERYILEGALVFSTPEPALRFYASNRIDAIVDRPPDGSHRARLVPKMRELIEGIIAQEGTFRVPKSVGYFVALAGSHPEPPRTGHQVNRVHGEKPDT